MAATYGEQVLVRAEARARTRSSRRRLALMLPAIATAFWALADLLAARHARLVAADANALRVLVDPVLPAAWTVLFVAMPLVAALKRDPLPAGAGLAFLAGPIVTPMLFGAGGWHAWQIAVIVPVSVLVLAAARLRARRLPD